MSKLVDLFQGTQYARLDKLSGHSPNTANAQEFSVRKQSNTDPTVRQGNTDVPILNYILYEIHPLQCEYMYQMPC